MTINIGDEYVISTRYGFQMTPWAKICKVEKVHKNGRVILSDSRRQWTQYSDGDSLSSGGGEVSYRLTAYRLTEERRKEAEQQIAIMRARDVIRDEARALELMLRASAGDKDILYTAALIAKRNGDSKQ